ncbi:MAG: hypothetical protein IJH20_05855 [Bacilli bacterium]|nr:hypothetical protein [Bacilli bacterium]
MFSGIREEIIKDIVEKKIIVPKIIIIILVLEIIDVLKISVKEADICLSTSFSFITSLGLIIKAIIKLLK